MYSTKIKRFKMPILIKCDIKTNKLLEEKKKQYKLPKTTLVRYAVWNLDYMSLEEEFNKKRKSKILKLR
jgi:hypothetical protein